MPSTLTRNRCDWFGFFSAFDFQDRVMGLGYSSRDQRLYFMTVGDVDGAWDSFKNDRCLLLQLYHRYYSTNRRIINVADPKEAPLDPAMFGCQARP
jgi:hypothetical protein